MSDKIDPRDRRSDEDWMEMAEKALWDSASGAEIEQEKLDKDGNIHLLRAKLPPNVPAAIYITKNRGKGRWADKIETSHTQINVNLTANYNTIQAKLAAQREKLATKKEEIIEAEVIDDASNADG